MNEDVESVSRVFFEPSTIGQRYDVNPALMIGVYYHEKLDFRCFRDSRLAYYDNLVINKEK